MKRKIFVVAAAIISNHSIAQTDSAQTLQEVTVTANKFEQKQNTTGKFVSVITREQIERSAGKDLAQLLNEQTGITVNGAVSNPGKDKSLFLRGASDKYTLILLDGVPLNEPAGVGGSFDLRLLSLDNIERIEILKGSQSTLYGSNAVAGVINIISKKSTSSNPQVSGLASYGSFNTFKGNANIGQHAKRFEYNLNYVYLNTDGISEAKDTSGHGSFDKDGFTKHAIQVMTGINVSDKIKISPYYRFSQFNGGYDADAFTDAPNKYAASLVNTGITGRCDYEGGALYFNYGYDFTKRNYQGLYGTFATSGRFHHAEIYTQHTLADNLKLLAGANFQVYRLPHPDTANSMLSPYASLYFRSRQGLNIELGGRFNHHNKYGNNFTYSFNPSYLIDNNTKLFINITSGFRAPSINELFGPYGGNPGLKPEKSAVQEIGLQTSSAGKKITATITGFNRTIHDVIIYGPAFTYENRDKQHDFGAELELACMPMTALNVKASYTYINGEITQNTAGKDTSFYNLVRRPKHTVNLFAGYQVTEQLFINASLQYIGKRTDNYYDPVTFTPSQVELKAYTLLNMYAEYKLLNGRLNIFIDAKNITGNTNFYEVYGYSVPGMNITGGIRFKL